MPVASLNTAWFALIGLLWAGYFVLEGFDFGVGMLVPVIARSDLERRLCINTIGPTWDGNEVWLLVAGGATFAAFPTWYATMFSAFYLPLFLVLVGLIVRGVSFEFRGKDRAPAWRATWDRALFWGSLVPALLWGVAFTDLVAGIDVGPGPRYLGGLLGLLHPVALLGGLVSPVGALVGGLVTGLAISFVGGYVGSDLQPLTALALLLLVLMARPQGLFGGAAARRV